MHHFTINLCYILLALATLFIFSSNADFTFKFEILQYKAVLQNQVPNTTQNASSKIDCTRKCANNPKCMAFYMPNITGTLGAKQWLCSLLFKKVSENQIFSGDGIYGRLKNIKPKPSPQLTSGVFEAVTKTEHGLAALFNCSSADDRMTNLVVLYNHDMNRWPNISPSCASTLCQQFGLAAALLNITEDRTNNNYHAQVLCQNDEIHSSDAFCDEAGQWSLSGPLKVGCVPSNCYISGVNGGAVYRGKETRSENNIECQRWDSQWPRTHSYNTSKNMFAEDGYNITLAANYCRDPDADHGRPWCYQMTGGRWGNCDIPRCQREL